MDFRIEKGPLTVGAFLTWSQKHTGVNSLLQNGNHVLMWDFDGAPQQDISKALWSISTEFVLPPIRLLQSSDEQHYHAWCFHQVTYGNMFRILAATPYVDKTWLKIGAVREFWTLRITEKNGQSPRYIGAIKTNDKKEDLTLHGQLTVLDYYSRRL